MNWMKSWRWPLALAPAFVVAAACAHEPTAGQSTATVTAALTEPEEPPPDQPVTSRESESSKRFKTLLADEKPALDLGADTQQQAAAALEAMFAGLDPGFTRRGMNSSGQVQCLRNGCFKEIYFPDQQVLREVTEVLLPRPGPARARAMSRFSIAHTGRTPQGPGFVVTWAVLYPAKQPDCAPEEGCKP